MGFKGTLHKGSPLHENMSFKHANYFRGVVSFLKPGWLRGENVLQVRHFEDSTLYFLKNQGG